MERQREKKGKIKSLNVLGWFYDFQPTYFSNAMFIRGGAGGKGMSKMLYNL